MGNTLTWKMGRQLASFGNISYAYNEDGIRTSKTSNGVTTKFYLDGTNIIEQTEGTTTLYFFYDSVGEIVGFKYNSNNYLYVKNSMGDIVGIADAAGNLITSYTYDAWGKVISVTGSNTVIGELNPFRYRSYYYDSDIQLYYLQTRYYDPEIGRFINSDDVNFIGLTTSEIFYNPFAYCKNNPINDSDPSGSVPYKVLQGIFGGIMGALTQYLADLINVKFFKGQWSSVVDYLKSVVDGAWDAVTNTGFFKALLISVGKNVIEQIINKITKKSNFSALSVFTTVIDFSIDYVIGEFLNIKAPKTIKDIKAKARSLGIKGTKKLTQYLNKQVFKINLANVTVSNIKNLIKSVIQNALNSVWGSKAKLIT